MHMYTHTYPNNKKYNFLKNNELFSSLQGDGYGASFKSVLHKFVFLSNHLFKKINKQAFALYFKL